MTEHKIDQTEEEMIDLFRLMQEFLRALRRLFWVPLLLALLAGAAMGLRGWRGYRPMYASQVTFTIQIASTAQSNLSSSSYYNKTTAEQLAKTFPYIIQSDLMGTMLKQEMGMSRINGSITAQAVDNTNLFSIKVTSPDAQDAYDILNAVIQVYPKAANYVIGSTKMDILSQPTVAQQPYNSFRALPTVARGAMYGVLLGLVLVLAYALTRRSVREPDDVQKMLNQTCLASLPVVTFKRRSQMGDQSISIRNPKISNSFQESVRGLRIKFLRKADKSPTQVVMVTSTIPGEGKTTVASNLALTLSQSGARVILVDLDLRHPSIKRALGVTDPTAGVSALLDGNERNIRDCLFPVEGSTLRLLAGDDSAQDSRQRTTSRKLSRLVQELRQEADYIILDTPPCGIVSDAASVARMADGIVYVLHAGAAQIPHVLDSLQLLSDSGTPLMGCVLNGVKSGRGGYGYYGYGGYYGGKYASHSKEIRKTSEHP